jgi:predicted Fe-S protein YdhL (DUF1289 family)
MTASPCINICQMDQDSGLCVGCYRTIEEISAWSRASDDEQRRITTKVLQRRLQTQEEQYLCVGVCILDADSGYCLGCGRPPLGDPDTPA